MNVSKYYLVSALILSSVLSGCKYSNEFKGTFNDQPATLDAYSKNINKYCIALTLDSGSTHQSYSASSDDLFVASNFLAPSSYNTKPSNCGSTFPNYLVGTRNVTVLGTSEVQDIAQVGFDYCRVEYYRQYHYQESVSFEVRQRADDSLVGKFLGTGSPGYFTDDSVTLRVGPVYYCGSYYPNYPWYPGYPGFPYPGPFPGPHPRPHRP